MLVKRHLGLVHTIAMARLCDRQSAEDLAQEVFLRALLGLDQLKNPRRFSAWLAQTTRNLAADWNRRDQRRSRLVPLVPIEDANDIPDDNPRGVQREMESSEESTLVHQAIGKLVPEQREIVLLHCMEGLDQREIARRLGIHQATVGRHLKKAMKLLQGILEVTLQRAKPSYQMSQTFQRQTVGLVVAAAALSGSAKAALAAAAATGAVAKTGLGVNLALKIKGLLLGAKGIATIVGASAVLVAGVFLTGGDKGPEASRAVTAAETRELAPLHLAILEFHRRHGRNPEFVVGSDPRSVANGDPLMAAMPTFPRSDYELLIEPNPTDTLFDPHNPMGSPQSYYSEGDAWILICPGYNEAYDLNPIGVFHEGATRASPEIAAHIYDPTNGLHSGGDLITIGP